MGLVTDTMSPKRALELAKKSYSKWSEHQAPRLGASVAFYSVLSFAPLLVLTTAVIALIFGKSSAQGALVNEARQWIGDRGAETVQSLLKSAQKPASGIVSSIIAFITLLFGASGVFTELQEALNTIWEAPAQTASGFMGMVKQRVFSFGMVLSVGFLLLVSLVLSAGLAFVGHSFGQLVPLPPAVLQTINFLVSFAVISVLFALMFKYVPNTKVAWRNALAGAVGTALLFTIGKLLLGLYLGKASVGSTYGAAGSLVAVIVWIYYSAQIFFFGAEFTYIYSEPDASKSAAPAKKADPAQDAAPKPGQPQSQPENKPALLPPPAMALLPAVSNAPLPHHNSSLPRRSRTAPHHVTKPRLLVALGVGFLLGRVFASRRDS